jgi:hypothetical protein
MLYFSLLTRIPSSTHPYQISLPSILSEQEQGKDLNSNSNSGSKSTCNPSFALLILLNQDYIIFINIRVKVLFKVIIQTKTPKVKGKRNKRPSISIGSFSSKGTREENKGQEKNKHHTTVTPSYLRRRSVA